MKFKHYIKEHSREFLQLLKEDAPDIAIKTITHNKPLLVFWVSPDGEIIDAKEAHHKNPPNKDKSILSDKKHKGYLRGRSAFIGKQIYVVIYGTDNKNLTNYQLALLKRSYPRLLDAIKTKLSIKDKSKIDNTLFINELGEDIEV